ncbi:MAG: hypothetical protein IJV45_10310 [Prevotella sp.]|nr:hypothetical protein [Prevotella sp.]
MEYVRPKVELYRTRTFSEKISDTFAFIKDTWRPMLKYFVYLMLPVSIVLGFFMNNFFSGYMGILMSTAGGGAEGLDTPQVVRFVGMTVGLTVCALVSSLLLMGLVYAMLRLYGRRDDRLKNLTTAELKPELMHCMGRTLKLLLAGIVIGLLIGVLVALLMMLMFSFNPIVGAVFVLLFYIGLVALMLPFALTMPIYLMEDEIGIIEALQKAWRLGIATWGGIFAVEFVLGLIGSLLQTLTFLPWYLLVVFGMVFTLQGEGGGFAGSTGYAFLQYLSSVWMCLGYLLVAVLSTVGLTIQYGHASDKIDGVGVAAGIEKFEEFDNV